MESSVPLSMGALPIAPQETVKPSDIERKAGAPSEKLMTQSDVQQLLAFNESTSWPVEYCRDLEEYRKHFDHAFTNLTKSIYDHDRLAAEALREYISCSALRALNERFEQEIRDSNARGRPLAQHLVAWIQVRRLADKSFARGEQLLPYATIYTPIVDIPYGFKESQPSETANAASSGPNSANLNVPHQYRHSPLSNEAVGYAPRAAPSQQLPAPQFSGAGLATISGPDPVSLNAPNQHRHSPIETTARAGNSGYANNGQSIGRHPSAQPSSQQPNLLPLSEADFISQAGHGRAKALLRLGIADTNKDPAVRRQARPPFHPPLREHETSGVEIPQRNGKNDTRHGAAMNARTSPDRHDGPQKKSSRKRKTTPDSDKCRNTKTSKKISPPGRPSQYAISNQADNEELRKRGKTLSKEELDAALTTEEKERYSNVRQALSRVPFPPQQPMPAQAQPPQIPPPSVGFQAPLGPRASNPLFSQMSPTVNPYPPMNNRVPPPQYPFAPNAYGNFQPAHPQGVMTPGQASLSPSGDYFSSPLIQSPFVPYGNQIPELGLGMPGFQSQMMAQRQLQQYTPPPNELQPTFLIGPDPRMCGHHQPPPLQNANSFGGMQYQLGFHGHNGYGPGQVHPSGIDGYYGSPDAVYFTAPNGH